MEGNGSSKEWAVSTALYFPFFNNSSIDLWIKLDMLVIYRWMNMIAHIFMRCTNTTARITTTAFLNRNSHDSFILSVPVVRSFGGFILTGKFLDSYRTFVCHINSPLFMPWVIRFPKACWRRTIERWRVLPLPFVGANWTKAFYRALRAAT